MRGIFNHITNYKSKVVNLELEVLKMKIIIIFIDLLMATVLFFVGRFFIKSRNTERSVLFLSGDYTGLNTEKICRVTGKRIKTWAMLFCLGGIIDFIKPGAGIIIVSSAHHSLRHKRMLVLRPLIISTLLTSFVIGQFSGSPIIMLKQGEFYSILLPLRQE